MMTIERLKGCAQQLRDALLLGGIINIRDAATLAATTIDRVIDESGADGGLAAAMNLALSAGVTDDAMGSIKKKVDDIIVTVEDDIMWRLKDELAGNLVAYVRDMAKQTVEQLLAGNEDQMRRYLSCEKRAEDGEYIGWTGRSDSKYWGRQREPHEWHPVIHGTLFEQGAVELRKRIVEAHADLLKDERMRDLEDQVTSLVAQRNKIAGELEREQRARVERRED